MNQGVFKLAGSMGVSRLGFGTLRLTEERGLGPARDGAVELLREAVKLGVNFIDTADSYGPETAENVIREALYPYPKGLVIATKGGYEQPGWIPNTRPEHLRRACEGSLKRLKVDCIDLYQLHTPDPESDIPYAESVGALKRLQDQGKILRIGVSRVMLDQLNTACSVAEIVSVQNLFNIKCTHYADVLAFCERKRIAFISWAPLNEGPLPPIDSVARVMAKPKHRGATSAQVMLSALLHLSDVMIPIPGTGSIDHLHENMTAPSLELDEDDLAILWPDLIPKSM